MTTAFSAGFDRPTRAPEKSLQLAVLQMVLVVVTTCLWFGWVDENKFLEDHIDRTKALIASNPHNFDVIQFGPAAGMTHAQNAVLIEEKQFHYLERQRNQGWKIIPLTAWTFFVLFLFYSRRAKSKCEYYIETWYLREKSERFARLVAVIIGLAAILPTYVATGNAQSGAGVALICGLYAYWFLRPPKVKVREYVSQQLDKEVGI